MAGVWNKIVSGGKKAAKRGAKAAKEFDRQMVESHGGGQGSMEPDMGGGQTLALNVVQRENGDWEVANPNGTALRVFSTKAQAKRHAEQMITSGGKYTQYQVLNPDATSTDNLVEETATYEPETGSQGAQSGSTFDPLGGGDTERAMGEIDLGLGGGGDGMREPSMPDALGASDDADDDFPPLY